MHKVTVHFVIFEAPGSFVAESFKREVAGPDPHAVEWPENAYAFRLFRRVDVIDGDDAYTGKSVQIGKTYYHPDSKVETLAQVRENPKATPTLIGNMAGNGWEQIVWSRWGNWPQPFEAADSEVLTHGVMGTPADQLLRDLVDAHAEWDALHWSQRNQPGAADKLLEARRKARDYVATRGVAGTGGTDVR